MSISSEDISNAGWVLVFAIPWIVAALGIAFRHKLGRRVGQCEDFDSGDPIDPHGIGNTFPPGPGNGWGSMPGHPTFDPDHF